MNVSQFVAKWREVELTERSASQQHFLDLCNVFQHPTPAEADPLGEWFSFEKGAEKQGGGQGWADVWKRGFFGWEYKGKHKDLVGAYAQLLRYREALENPPLLYRAHRREGFGTWASLPDPSRTSVRRGDFPKDHQRRNQADRILRRLGESACRI